MPEDAETIIREAQAVIDSLIPDTLPYRVDQVTPLTPVEVLVPPPTPGQSVRFVTMVRTNDEHLRSEPYLNSTGVIQTTNNSHEWYRGPMQGLTRVGSEAHNYSLEYFFLNAQSHNVFIPDIPIAYPHIPVPTPAPVQPVKDGKILLTFQQCRDHAPMLKLKRMYLLTNGNYWNEPIGTGYTIHRENAARCVFDTAVTGWTHAELVDQDLALKISKIKCCAEMVVGASLMNLIKAAPTNMTVRAKIMAVVGIMPDAALDDWDKIKEWIESTYTPKDPGLLNPMPLDPGVEVETLQIPMRFSQSQFGTCRYSGTAYGNGTMSIDPEIMSNILYGDRTLEQMLQEIRDEANQQAWEFCDPPCDLDRDSIEAERFDCNDTDDHTCEIAIPYDELRRRFIAFLRRTQTQETLARLGIQP